MSWKTVLYVTAPGEGDADLKTAIALCNSIGAHLSVLVMATAAPPPIGEYAAVVSEAWNEERQLDMTALSERVAHVSSVLGASGISHDVTSTYCELALADGEVGAHAQYADLLLVGAGLPDERRVRTSVLEGGLFRSPAPVLLAPSDMAIRLDPEAIVLAWNSSLESSRAARHAIDLMKAAREVHVTLVDPDASEGANGEEPGADIASFLARHGINVSVDLLSSGQRPVAAVLKQHAMDVAAGMIVMGAYGHSRLREWIFGGVTREMLKQPPSIPMLVCH